MPTKGRPRNPSQCQPANISAHSVSSLTTQTPSYHVQKCSFGSSKPSFSARRISWLVFCTGDTAGFFCHTAPVTHHTAPIVGTLLAVMGSTRGFTLKTMVLTPQY